MVSIRQHIEMAARIARWARAMGADATVEASAASAYVQVDGPDGELKIRVSDHALPPSYGALRGWAQYEVGSRVHHDVDGDWLDAVAWLARRLDRPLPGRVAALIARRDAKQAALAAQRAALEAEGAAARRAQGEALAARLRAAGLLEKYEAAIAGGNLKRARRIKEKARKRAMEAR